MVALMAKRATPDAARADRRIASDASAMRTRMGRGDGGIVVAELSARCELYVRREG
jgi:hypothetical protein